jgi:small ligand-binding sensory domain FIST
MKRKDAIDMIRADFTRLQTAYLIDCEQRGIIGTTEELNNYAGASALFSIATNAMRMAPKNIKRQFSNSIAKENGITT